MDWDWDWCGTRIPGRLPLPPRPNSPFGLGVMPSFGGHIGIAGVGGGVIAVK